MHFRRNQSVIPNYSSRHYICHCHTFSKKFSDLLKYVPAEVVKIFNFIIPWPWKTSFLLKIPYNNIEGTKTVSGHTREGWLSQKSTCAIVPALSGISCFFSMKYHFHLKKIIDNLWLIWFLVLSRHKQSKLMISRKKYWKAKTGIVFASLS